MDYNDVLKKVSLLGILGKDDASQEYNTPIPAELANDYAKFVWDRAVATGRDVRNDAGDYDIQGYFLSGETPDSRGHGTDTFKKPNHPTFSTGSMYSTEENPGGQWTESGFIPSEVNKKNMSQEDLMRYFSMVEPGYGLTYEIGNRPFNVMAK